MLQVLQRKHLAIGRKPVNLRLSGPRLMPKPDRLAYCQFDQFEEPSTPAIVVCLNVRCAGICSVTSPFSLDWLAGVPATQLSVRCIQLDNGFWHDAERNT